MVEEEVGPLLVDAVEFEIVVEVVAWSMVVVETIVAVIVDTATESNEPIEMAMPEEEVVAFVGAVVDVDSRGRLAVIA